VLVNYLPIIDFLLFVLIYSIIILHIYRFVISFSQDDFFFFYVCTMLPLKYILSFCCTIGKKKKEKNVIINIIILYRVFFVIQNGSRFIFSFMLMCVYNSFVSMCSSVSHSISERQSV
jgi:hypothetical protein